MNQKKFVLDSNQQRSWQNSYVKPAWKGIISLIVVILILLLAAPALLVLVFPLYSLALGIYLYRRYPVLYVGFTWWLWFLGTFVKRLIDYRCGYITPFPYHLTPLLVTSISVITLIKHFPKTYKRDGLPFVLCAATIFYGFMVGLLRQPITDYERELIVLLSWLAPVCFGFHLYINWRNYPLYRRNFQQVFLWAVVIMGTYGFFQFLVAPAWDVFFLVNTPTFNGYGSYMGMPEPLGIRPWGTMGNPMIFAFNMMPGLILLLTCNNKMAYVGGIFGYLTFLISRVRSSWYSWVIAIVLLVSSLKQRHQIRFIAGALMLVVLLVPIATVEPFSDIIGTRLQSISNIGSDNSFQSRMSQLNQSLDFISSEFIGWGLVAPGQAPQSDSYSSHGSGIFSVMDNGYLAIITSFGWFASLLYVSGILLLIAQSFRNNNLDTFAIASRSIAIASIGRIATSDVTTQAYAMPIWGFFGIALAAQKYYARQRLSQ